MCTHPAVGVIWPEIDLERRGLAAAVGSEQGDHAALRHDEVDAVQHLDAPVRGLDAAELEQRDLGRAFE